MKIHFIGICGVSMRMLAELARREGHRVTGSDLSMSGHAASLLGDAEVVVYSGAVGEDNPELVEARRRGLPCVSRARFLAETAKRFDTVVAVAGSHGKTTVTAMLYSILKPFDPTLHLGGTLADGQNGHVGKKQYFVTEACEYRRSFLTLAPALSLVLNVELDHTDYYRDLDDITDAFVHFASAGRQALVSGDDVRSAPLAERGYPTFGLRPANRFYAADLVAGPHDCYSFTLYDNLLPDPEIGRVTLTVPGVYNVVNAVAAAGAARLLGIDRLTIVEGLGAFRGVKRRFEWLGKRGGADVFTDYAHHPSELKAAITAAKKMGFRRVVAVFEPHTYSRTEGLFDGFVDALSYADSVWLLPVFAAREPPSDRVRSEMIASALAAKGYDAHCAASYDALLGVLPAHLQDCLLFLGAGNIDKAAAQFVAAGRKDPQ